jgi:hypothetical protein
MTVTAIRKDAQSRTMTLEAEFDASLERVWQLWADRRQLASIESEFPSVEAMEQLAAMGTEEGLTQAVGQIDAILAEDPVARR